MALVVPAIENITNGSNGYDFCSVADSTDWAAATDGNGITNSTGGVVTPSSGMVVAIAAFNYEINSIEYAYAGGTATVGAHSTSDRRDIITISSAGTVTVTAGTACGTAGWTRSSTTSPPIKPAIPADPSGGDQFLIAEIAVTATTTTIATANIVDKTVIRNPTTGDFTGSSLATAVTVAAGTATNTTVITTPSIGVGTWTVDCQAGIEFTATTSNATGAVLFVGAGTATVSFVGPTSSEMAKFSGATGSYGEANVTCLAEVTGAGTLLMEMSAAVTVTAVTRDLAAKGNPTGIVLVRIG